MIYLIHFSEPVGRALHYLGCTDDNRLERRLTEHARGTGAKLTARAIQQGKTLYLARVFPLLSYEQEKRIKRQSHFSKLCPLCCPLFAHLANEVVTIDPKRPEQPPIRAIWDWRPKPTKTETSP